MKQAEAQLLGLIWLNASLVAHDFIQPNYWRNNLEAMVTQYIPGAETYVYETDNEIVGFVSFVDAGTVAAIFVSPAKQGRGVGGKLIRFAKERYNKLSLTVYSKNMKSRAFYEKHGFIGRSEGLDEATGEKEIIMTWTKESE